MRSRIGFRHGLRFVPSTSETLEILRAYSAPHASFDPASRSNLEQKLLNGPECFKRMAISQFFWHLVPYGCHWSIPLCQVRRSKSNSACALGAARPGRLQLPHLRLTQGDIRGWTSEASQNGENK